jgi:hypothetical protein
VAIGGHSGGGGGGGGGGVELPIAAALVFSLGTAFVIMPIRPLRSKAKPTVANSPRVVLMLSPASMRALMRSY